MSLYKKIKEYICYNEKGFLKQNNTIYRNNKNKSLILVQYAQELSTLLLISLCGDIFSPDASKLV